MSKTLLNSESLEELYDDALILSHPSYQEAAELFGIPITRTALWGTVGNGDFDIEIALWRKLRGAYK